AMHHDQRVAIGRAAGDAAEDNRLSGAGARFPDDRLAEPRRQRIGDDARHQIGVGARRIAVRQQDGMARVGVLRDGRSNGAQRHAHSQKYGGKSFCHGFLPTISTAAASMPVQCLALLPFPVQSVGWLCLIRRLSFTSSLIAPAIGIASPALSAILATICMSFSAQRNDTFSQFFSASDAPDEISSASRSLTRSMPLASDSRPASISAMPFTQSRKLFIALPNWPAPMSPSST